MNAAPEIVRAQWGDLLVRETPEAIIFVERARKLCALRTICLRQIQPAAGPLAEKRYYAVLCEAQNDPLAERLLQTEEPNFVTIAGLLPPLLGPAFIGAEQTEERVELDAGGGCDLWKEGGAPKQLAAVGLLDGWLPALCYRYAEGERITEQIVFGTANVEGRLCLWRRLRVIAPEGSAAPCVIYQADGEPAAAEEFYAAMLSLWRWADESRRSGMRLKLPEPEMQEAALAMMLWGVLTFRGLAPRYGVGSYDETRHHSFPPATIFLAQALLQWGHITHARDILAHYLSRYVKPEGTFDYYGPALSEYGQWLVLIAEYVRLSGDREWLRRRVTLLRPLWRRLLALRRESEGRWPEDDPHHGLIPGLPEADYADQPEQWEAFYYSGDLWACRGLWEIGRLLSEEPAPLGCEGAALLAEAEAYRADILRSLAQAAEGPTGYIPPGPDQREPIMRLTGDRHASYCNYRYFPEMMSAGLLPLELVRRLWQWRREHGGELLGMTRFMGHLDDWPALHVARALLEMDEADRYLLLLYAHWAHHCAAGTLAAYEQVAITPNEEGVRPLLAGQVVPCQILLPLMLRWALAYEDRDAARLWLCRAIPRHWLQPGSRLRVRRVPTRFGRIGFTLRIEEEGRGRLTLRLPKSGLPAEICVRLRLPAGKITEARLGDQLLRQEGDLLLLPPGLRGKQRVTLSWAPF